MAATRHAAERRAHASSIDYDATLQQVVRLPIPTLADWSMVYVPDDGGAFPARLMLAHARPAKEALLGKVWDREWSILPEQHPIAARWLKPGWPCACARSSCFSTTNELLDLVAAVRERRRRGRGRVLHWPGTAPTETLTNELEEIAYRLSAAGDPFTSPL